VGSSKKAVKPELIMILAGLPFYAPGEFARYFLAPALVRLATAGSLDKATRASLDYAFKYGPDRSPSSRLITQRLDGELNKSYGYFCNSNSPGNGYFV
jgi:hypothetical protein